MDLIFLPEALVNLNIFDETKLIIFGELMQVEFGVSARTNQKEYRRRSLEDYETAIETEGLSEEVSDRIKNYIDSHISVGCWDKKYPSIELKGYLVETYVDYDDDRNRGFAFLHGHVWVLIPK